MSDAAVGCDHKRAHARAHLAARGRRREEGLDRAAPHVLGRHVDAARAQARGERGGAAAPVGGDADQAGDAEPELGEVLVENGRDRGGRLALHGVRARHLRDALEREVPGLGVGLGRGRGGVDGRAGVAPGRLLEQGRERGDVRGGRRARGGGVAARGRGREG